MFYVWYDLDGRKVASHSSFAEAVNNAHGLQENGGSVLAIESSEGRMVWAGADLKAELDSQAVRVTVAVQTSRWWTWVRDPFGEWVRTNHGDAGLQDLATALRAAFAGLPEHRWTVTLSGVVPSARRIGPGPSRPPVEKRAPGG